VVQAENNMAVKLFPKHVFDSYGVKEASIIDLKLPSAIRIQPTAFNAETYQIED
jgi:hypothetical protein